MLFSAKVDESAVVNVEVARCEASHNHPIPFLQKTNTIHRKGVENLILLPLHQSDCCALVPKQEFWILHFVLNCAFCIGETKICMLYFVFIYRE